MICPSVTRTKRRSMSIDYLSITEIDQASPNTLTTDLPFFLPSLSSSSHLSFSFFLIPSIPPSLIFLHFFFPISICPSVQRFILSIYPSILPPFFFPSPVSPTLTPSLSLSFLPFLFASLISFLTTAFFLHVYLHPSNPVPSSLSSSSSSLLPFSISSFSYTLP